MTLDGFGGLKVGLTGGQSGMIAEGIELGRITVYMTVGDILEGRPWRVACENQTLDDTNVPYVCCTLCIMSVQSAVSPSPPRVRT